MGSKLKKANSQGNAVFLGVTMDTHTTLFWSSPEKCRNQMKYEENSKKNRVSYVDGRNLAPVALENLPARAKLRQGVIVPEGIVKARFSFGWGLIFCLECWVFGMFSSPKTRILHKKVPPPHQFGFRTKMWFCSSTYLLNTCRFKCACWFRTVRGSVFWLYPTWLPLPQLGQNGQKLRHLTFENVHFDATFGQHLCQSIVSL